MIGTLAHANSVTEVFHDLTLATHDQSSLTTVILNKVKDLLLALTHSKPRTSRSFVAALLRMTLR